MINRGFPAEFIAQVKERNDIISVLSKSITLEKKGKTFWACCPFHFEKTPSFAVNEDEQFYHCYGCGESGDVISFIQKYENLSFYEAVKLLASSAGLELPQYSNTMEDMEKLRTKEKVLRALNLAKDYYCQCLKSTSDSKVLDYIKKRDFNSKVIEDFNIGYSPDWKSLIKYLSQNNVDLKTMNLAGLVDYNDNKEPYDVFATRLIFPILNNLGDCIGFTARSLENNPNYAKYRNSTQTIVFDKSKTIYNIYNVKQFKKEHQKLDYIIICEGTIDVIAMHKAGFKNSVACMGTAITPYHAKELKKLVDKIILCLDGDSAGQNATYKAIDILLSAGLEVRVVSLKDNLDPDEYLKKYGSSELNDCINNAIDGIEFKINLLEKNHNLKDNFEKNKFINQCMEILSNLNTNSEKEIYLKIISKKTNISQDILRRDILSNSTTLPKQDKDENSILISRPEGYLKAQQFILASIIHKKDYAKGILDKDFTFQNSNYNKLFNFAKNCCINNKSYTISSLFDYFDVENNPDIAEIINFNFNNFGDNLDIYFNECIKKISYLELKNKQEELTQAFKNEIDLEKRKEIAVKLNNIAKEIKNWR